MSENRKITVAKAIREALEEEMRNDSSVILMGQDIKRSVWGITGGLQEEFGEDRLIPLPISENGFSGAAVGAALTGLRPVVEFMYGDFLALAMDAICNQAAKYRYMLGGGVCRVPVVFRFSGCGIGSGMGLQHSQYPESWGMHFPGLKILAPATPNDAKGLMKSAIKDNNPVMFFEYKQLYSKSGIIETEDYIQIGKAKVVKEGQHVTLVTWATGYYKALSAVETLASDGIDVEMIDLRTIKPLDKDTIIESLKKTNRLIIVEDGCKTGGIGAEIAAIVAEEAIAFLDGPVVRLAGADTNIPAGKKAEKLVVPSEDEIVNAIREMF